MQPTLPPPVPKRRPRWPWITAVAITGTALIIGATVVVAENVSGEEVPAAAAVEPRVEAPPKTEAPTPTTEAPAPTTARPAVPESAPAPEPAPVPEPGPAPAPQPAPAPAPVPPPPPPVVATPPPPPDPWKIAPGVIEDGTWYGYLNSTSVYGYNIVFDRVTMDANGFWINQGAIYRTLPVAPAAWAWVSSVWQGMPVQIEVHDQHVTAIYEAYPPHDLTGMSVGNEFEGECGC
jgi:hypothetical protein